MAIKDLHLLRCQRRPAWFSTQEHTVQTQMQKQVHIQIHTQIQIQIHIQMSSSFDSSQNYKGSFFIQIISSTQMQIQIQSPTDG